MGLVAAVAVALLVVMEFRDGLPPRFVIRSIPGRVAQLERGMSHPQVSEILGLERSWILGGTGAQFHMGSGNARTRYDTYIFRPLRTVTLEQPDGTSSPVRIVQSSASLQLRFRRDYPNGGWFSSRESDRLEWASFSIDGRTIAERPGTCDAK